MSNPIFDIAKQASLQALRNPDNLDIEKEEAEEREIRNDHYEENIAPLFKRGD